MRPRHFGALVPPARNAGLRMGATWEKGQKAMTAPRPRTRQSKQLDAGMLQAEISSFALHLAAGNKSAKTIRTYTEAAQWFAAAHLLDRYSSAYASNQYRALQQFFKWLAAEDELPDQTAGHHDQPHPQNIRPDAKITKTQT
jgi:hypothetical protein